MLLAGKITRVSPAAAREPSLKVSEVFESLQGEGATAGEPAAFLRLATCNLHCGWCDTKYTWDWNNHRYADEVETRSVASVATQLSAFAPRRLVLTGGEPLLQQTGIEGLLERLGTEWVIEVETNGTQEPSPALLARVDQWNVSAKLSNSGNRVGLRIRPAVLARLLGSGRAWLKLVVQDNADFAEAEALCRQTAWPPERVLWMPQASTRDELAEHAPRVARAAAQRGFGVSPRRHLELWGGRRGT